MKLSAKNEEMKKRRTFYRMPTCPLMALSEPRTKTKLAKN
jgi:hypothetical protein